MPTFLYYKKLACWGMKLAARSVRSAAACARWRLRGLTSVGWLISNRSSRLAFQWLMMSASFRRSSSRLPDILKSRLNLETIRLSPRWFGFIHSNGLLIRRPEIKVNLLHPETGLSNAVFCGERRSFPQSPVNAPQLYRRPLVLFPRSRLWFVLSRSVRAPRGKAVRAPSIDSRQNSLGTLTGTRTGTNVILGHKTSHKGQFFLLRFIHHLKAE